MEISFSNEIIMDSSVDQIYDYLSKMENFSIWNYAVIRVEAVEDHKDTYRLVRNLGQHVEIETITIIKAQKNKFLQFQATGGRFSYEMKYELKQLGNKTLLANYATMKPNGISGVLLKLLKGHIQTEVKNNLLVLKNIMEISIME
ncbi:SRPBCC family protein [Paenibacillus sepulcri]|uniref:SRPBCC family protein n=1 Tax=Paenibacillus sepulcri TaxID=359917 RepID=A0ABS7BYN3_9BACL|nr:hypothetical protein [Paenibacillus sepulcri]